MQSFIATGWVLLQARDSPPTLPAMGASSNFHGRGQCISGMTMTSDPVSTQKGRQMTESSELLWRRHTARTINGCLPTFTAKATQGSHSHPFMARATQGPRPLAVLGIPEVQMGLIEPLVGRRSWSFLEGAVGVEAPYPIEDCHSWVASCSRREGAGCSPDAPSPSCFPEAWIYIPLAKCPFFLHAQHGPLGFIWRGGTAVGGCPNRGQFIATWPAWPHLKHTITLVIAVRTAAWMGPRCSCFATCLIMSAMLDLGGNDLKMSLVAELHC